MRYLGMDVHVKSTVWCLLDAAGEVVEKGKGAVYGSRANRLGPATGEGRATPRRQACAEPQPSFQETPAPDGLITSIFEVSTAWWFERPIDWCMPCPPRACAWTGTTHGNAGRRRWS
jgi:hypothetical protein